MKLSACHNSREGGVPNLGSMPNDWTLKRLKDVVLRIGSGVTPKGGSSVYIDSGVVFLRSQNVYDKGLRISDVSYIDEDTHEKMKSSEIKPNDILINITGASIGRTCVVPPDLGKANINQHIIFLRLKSKDVRYVSNYLKSSFIKEYIMLVQNGASKEALNMHQLLSAPLLMPDTFAERQKITNYIDEKTTQIDKKIELLEKKIEYYKELRKSIVNEIVCRGLNTDVELKDSGVDWIGEIPKHWQVERAKKIFYESKKLSSKGEEDLLSVSEYYGVAKRSEKYSDEEYLSRSETLEGYKIVSSGDLVINIMLAWKRGLGVSEFDGIVSPAYGVYKPVKKREIYSKYFHFLLRTDKYISEFKRNSKGIIDSRLRLYSDSFFTINILVPKYEEQVKIAEYLIQKTNTIDSIVRVIEENVKVSKELRKTLINDVVTGKLKVN